MSCREDGAFGSCRFTCHWISFSGIAEKTGRGFGERSLRHRTLESEGGRKRERERELYVYLNLDMKGELVAGCIKSYCRGQWSSSNPNTSFTCAKM